MSDDTTANSNAKVDVQVPTGAQPNVVWDDSKMTTSFANVVNAVSSREEVTLFFGTNQTWNPSSSRDLKVELSDRIILTPHAAKRLWLLMGGLLKEYEQRNGTLEVTRARDRTTQ